MAATLVRRVLEETLQIHTNGTSEYEHVQTVSESPLWWVGVLLDAVATLAGTGGKQMRVSASKFWTPALEPSNAKDDSRWFQKSSTLGIFLSSPLVIVVLEI